MAERDDEGMALVDRDAVPESKAEIVLGDYIFCIGEVFENLDKEKGASATFEFGWQNGHTSIPRIIGVNCLKDSCLRIGG